MRQTGIDVLAMLIQHRVREVVVLVDNQIHQYAIHLGLVANIVELLRGPILPFHLGGKTGIEQVLILLRETVGLDAAIRVEVLAQIIDGACH